MTLGDDAAKQTITLGAMGGQAAVQIAGLFRGTYAYREARGNVVGTVEFVAETGYASYAAALSGWKTEYGRIGQSGELVLTEGATTATFAGAKLRSVERAWQVGLRWAFRYSLVVGAVT